MDDRKLSQRKLAKEMEVSEGTVRNALEYVKAEKVRNDYAPDEDFDLSSLSVEQIRYYNRLPQKFANLWVQCGGDILDLYKPYDIKTKIDMEEAKYCNEGNSWLFEDYKYLDDIGMTEFLSFSWSPEGFVSSVKDLKKWCKYIHKWHCKGIETKDILQYARHYIKGDHYVREKSLMDSALEILIYETDDGYKFKLTPEEFDSVFSDLENVSASHSDFMDRLKLVIYKKCGEKLSNIKETTWEELREIEIATKAPEYIKNSNLNIEQKPKPLS